jgi:hypothetical protein
MKEWVNSKQNGMLNNFYVDEKENVYIIGVQLPESYIAQNGPPASKIMRSIHKLNSNGVLLEVLIPNR